MPHTADNGGVFEVQCAGIIAQKLHEIQKHASQKERGIQVIRALRHIWRRLQHSSLQFGEPLYRLPALVMEIRQAVVGPLCVHFGVCEDKQFVFINGVSLLSQQDS